MKNKRIDFKRNSATKKKQIGFFSAMFFIACSCIGSGIFFRTATVFANSNNNLALSIVSWVVAALVVILMGLALVEIYSANKNDDRGVIAWIQNFNSNVMYQISKNFVSYIYLPIVLTLSPAFAVFAFTNAIQFLQPIETTPIKLEWWIVMLFTIMIITWFMFTSATDVKFGSHTSLVTMGFKFVPLSVAMFIGFYVIATTGNSVTTANVAIDVEKQAADFNSFNLNTFFPFFGIIGSLAAIFLTYDGFYFSGAVNSFVKNKKQIPWITISGLAIVTFVYLMISISLVFASENASWFSLNGSVIPRITFGVLSLFLAVGILGSVNTLCMYAKRFYEIMIERNEIILANQCQKYFKNKNWGSAFFTYAIALFVLIIFFLVGSFAYQPTTFTADLLTFQTAALFSFVDIVATWTSVGIFGFIGIALIGGIKNRKSNKVTVKKEKYFLPCAIVVSTILLFAMSYEGIRIVVNFIVNTMNYVQGQYTSINLILNDITLLVTLIVIFGIVTFPLFKSKKFLQKNKEVFLTL